MMHSPHQHSRLFRLASKLLKYFVYSLLGLGIFYLLSVVLGVLPLGQAVIIMLIPWLIRGGALIAGLMAMAIVIESLQ